MSSFPLPTLIVGGVGWGKLRFLGKKYQAFRFQSLDYSHLYTLHTERDNVGGGGTFSHSAPTVCVYTTPPPKLIPPPPPSKKNFVRYPPPPIHTHTKNVIRVQYLMYISKNSMRSLILRVTGRAVISSILVQLCWFHHEMLLGSDPTSIFQISMYTLSKKFWCT